MTLPADTAEPFGSPPEVLSAQPRAWPERPGVLTLCSRQSRALPLQSLSPFSCNLSGQAHVCLSLHEGLRPPQAELSPGDSAGQMCLELLPSSAQARRQGHPHVLCMTRVPSPEEPRFTCAHAMACLCLCPSLKGFMRIPMRTSILSSRRG